MPVFSAQLTLAGTLRGKRWRRQEVRACREEYQQLMAAVWVLVTLPSFSPLNSALGVPFPFLPFLRFLDISPAHRVPPPGLASSAFSHLCLSCQASYSSVALTNCLHPTKTNALTSTRSSNFLGFVSSFTRCCWSTAPWLRHLRMLSAGG